ncbi:DNA-3-methyladenine glycosylase 2 family protein [Microlunatus sp. Gsoil 973]|uniref:DNA-3-methyladenine glycosylase 2 family protein n=1 Tax=Microlunatus sp. Gsoil 973 TaxID=2672569 RepID=UPI0012B45D3F|nr:AlkA N-terminal domain-containing protein [Microlunatus sp. Gsoil 973]QGN31624.1 helix-turn-helix domain-containing protein [Microlunatus sp. Gsoil 973]
MFALPQTDVCYRAVAGKDPRYDGWIYVGVSSTGIYCRPSCPARTPKPENCRFFAAAGAAQAAGFRACRRCRPDTVPGSPQWNPRADAVARAMRLIADGLVDRDGVSGLAAAVGYSERQLNRLLVAEVGAGPLAIARAQRAQTARMLIENTDLRLSDIAFAAGFSSIRQFNDTLREVYGLAPSHIRSRRAGDQPSAGPTTITLKLPVRRPFAAEPLFEFLADRAIPGVEAGRRTQQRTGTRLTFVRSCSLPHGAGILELIMAAHGPLTATLRLDDLRDLSAAVSRIRRVLDLDADPVAVDSTLAADPALAQLVADRPGVRVPGVVDADELAFRALIGQQVSVAGARTTAARIVRQFGRPLPVDDHRPGDRPDDHPDEHGSDGGQLRYLFPTAAALAEADPETLPMPRSRGRALVGLATALASDRIDLSPGADRAQARARLLALPGIGPWTAGYIAMRGLGDPDVLLTEDLVIRRELQRRGLTSADSAWAPWRSYATMRLWQASRMELAA